MSNIQNLVNAVCSDFPSDRFVKENRDSITWFRVFKSSSTLMVPPVNIIRNNMSFLDKFIEAIKAFSVADLGSTAYDWDNLELYEYTDIDLVIEWMKELKIMLQGKKVACDIETRNLKWKDNKILSIGFATDENTCYAFYNLPIKGWKYDGPDLPPSVCHEVWSTLQRLLDDPNITYIWHNGKFDCGKLMYLSGLKARVDEDTQLKHYVQINEKKGTHKLKDLGPLYLQAPRWDDQLDKLKREYCKKHKIKLKEFQYDLIPTNILIPYMQRDCIATYRLNDVFDKLARPGSEFIYGKLIEASEAFLDVELAGMQIDLEYLEDIEWELEQRISEATEKLDKVSALVWDPVKYSKDTGAKCKADDTFNIKSPKKLKWMMHQVLGYPVPSTDAEMLESLLELVDEGEITDPIAVDFLSVIGEVRQNNKYMDTYVQGFRDQLCEDHRIRGTFNLHGTETGRLSSTDPNMQNIPRNKFIKNLFVSRDGYKLVQLDYSQAELRVLAYLSDDPWMIQVYVDGNDLHDAVATDMFGPDFDKEQRNMAKTINFGIAYGRGPKSIAQKFNKSMNEAKEIIAKWFKPMPKVEEWINNRRSMPQRGEPCVTLFGRERHFVITDEELYHIKNEYINTPVQSIASDCTMFSLIEINKYLKVNKYDARIIASVHDSIILEVVDDEQIINEVSRAATRIMADTPKQYLPNLTVPFRADVETGYRWGELDELEVM